MILVCPVLVRALVGFRGCCVEFGGVWCDGCGGVRDAGRGERRSIEAMNDVTWAGANVCLIT